MAHHQKTIIISNTFLRHLSNFSLYFQNSGDPGAGPSRIPWFVKQWQIPLNRCIYTAFSYMTFLLYIILYVSEVQPPAIHVIDILTAVWIVSYTFRDIGTGILSILIFNNTHDFTIESSIS